jgi:hypothetical protein
MTVDMGKNVQQLLEQLAAKIGTTVEHVWPWMVRAEVIDAWTELSVSAVLLVVFALCLAGAEWAWRRSNIDAFIPLVMIGGAGMVLTGVITAVRLSAWVQQIMNPEYCALLKLISMVKP